MQLTKWASQFNTRFVCKRKRMKILDLSNTPGILPNYNGKQYPKYLPLKAFKLPFVWWKPLLIYYFYMLGFFLFRTSLTVTYIKFSFFSTLVLNAEEELVLKSTNALSSCCVRGILGGNCLPSQSFMYNSYYFKTLASFYPHFRPVPTLFVLSILNSNCSPRLYGLLFVRLPWKHENRAIFLRLITPQQQKALISC